MATPALPTEIIQRFPKVELHTHLNGSIREQTLREWHPNHDVRSLIDAFLRPDTPSKEALESCFRAFALIHEAVNSFERLARLTTETLEDYDRETTVVLELRTTPRRIAGASLRAYVDVVIGAIQAYIAARTSTTPFVVYLLLSISRSALDDAAETLEIARELFPGGVVRGVELSGNPFAGDAASICPVFEAAQASGIPYTLHIAEKPDDAECAALLALHPPRVGHAVFASPEAFAQMERDNVAVEVCLTSNVVSRSIADAGAHPAKRGGVFAGTAVYCCDDRGLFRTTLSMELERAHAAYHTNEPLEEFLEAQCRAGLAHAFLTDAERTRLGQFVASKRASTGN